MEFDQHLLVCTSPIFKLTSLPLTLNVRQELTPLYVRYTYFSPHSAAVYLPCCSVHNSQPHCHPPVTIPVLSLIPDMSLYTVFYVPLMASLCTAVNILLHLIPPLKVLSVRIWKRGDGTCRFSGRLKWSNWRLHSDELQSGWLFVFCKRQIQGKSKQSSAH